MRPLLLPLLALALCAQPPLDQALAPSRRRINAIDDQIVQLLNERAAIVRQVGAIKQQYHAPAEAPGRAGQVLRRVSGQARPPLTPTDVRKIYEAVLAQMTAMESREMHQHSPRQ